MNNKYMSLWFSAAKKLAKTYCYSLFILFDITIKLYNITNSISLTEKQKKEKIRDALFELSNKIVSLKSSKEAEEITLKLYELTFDKEDLEKRRRDNIIDILSSFESELKA